MPTFPYQSHTLTIHDNTKNPNSGKIETSTVRLLSAQITDLNYVTKLAEFSALQTAIDDVILGRIFKRTFAGYTELVTSPSSPAPDVKAQREHQFVIKVEEAVTFEKHSITLPTANIDMLEANRERLDPALSEYTALILAVENFVEYNGNTVNVVDILYKGKNI